MAEAANGNSRLFEFSDDKSDKFWSISLKGASHTVAYGRTGTDGQSKTKDFANAEEAQKSYEKLIQQKTKKGYVEVQAGQSRNEQVKESKAQSKAELAARKPFLDSILEDPDELSNYHVYADWLMENGDPQGEFINVQLQLEDSNLPAATRKKLQATEKQLLKKHQREWIGEELANYLIDQKVSEDNEFEPTYSFKFARGFLDSIDFELVDLDFAEVFAKSDLRMARRFNVTQVDYEDDDGQSYLLLAKGKYDNCRSFTIGDYYPSYTANVVGVIKKMPRIEEIVFNSKDVDTQALFKLKMPHLRSISLEAGYEYPIEILGKNKSLGRLEHVHVLPHMLEPGDDDPYLTFEGFREFCKSKNLTSLKSISFCCTEYGDEGVKCLVKAPFFRQLEKINLSNGIIREEGALLLAEQDLSNIKMLNLESNFIPESAVDVLKGKVEKLSAAIQFSGEIDAESKEYLWEGSME